jgi:hypothetical protein
MRVGATPARTLEAAGAATTDFEFRGAGLTIPLAVEAWPLDAIRAGKAGRAVRILLGDQRPPMKTRGDVVELSARMADAVGVTPLPESKIPAAVFGAIPTLLTIVDGYGDDLEADLLRYFRVDYRQPVADGGPTLRQIWVYIRRLPADSALMAARNGGVSAWTRAEILTARLWELWAQKRYAGRPPSPEEIEEWRAIQAANEAEMNKLKGREHYYTSGQNMRDAGLDPGPRQEDSPQSNPVAAALATAQKNARRSPTGVTGNGQRPAGPAQRRGWGYDPRGSGWG